MKNKIIAHASANILYLFFFLFYPITYGTIGLAQVALVSIGLLGLAFIGSALLSYSKAITNIFVFWMLSYIIGGIFIGVLSSVLPTKALGFIFVFLCFVSIVIWIKRKAHLNLLANTTGLFSIALSAAIILAYTLIDSDIYQAQNTFPFQAENSLPDPYFFTLITQSLSVDHLFNAFYDQGGALNYQIISFLAPSFFTKLFDIPAQVSLWGIWMPAYKLFGFLLLAFGIKKSVKNTISSKWWIIPLIVTLLFALAPINPKYLIQLDLSKIVFLGTGYLLPGGNPPFTMAMALMGATLIFFKQSDWTKFDGILYTCLLALIIGTKTALFIPLGIYMGIMSLFKYNYDKKPLLYTISAAILGACIYAVLFGSSDGLIKIYFNPGFYIEYFNQLLQTTGLLSGTIIMVSSLLIWGGIRWLILATGLFQNKTKLLPEILAILTAMAFTVLLPLLFRFKLLAPDGSVLQDVSFDLIQFIRAAFFLLTISTIIVLFNLKFKQQKLNQITIIALCLYCSVTLASNIHRFMTEDVIEADNTWRKEVRNECTPKGLYAISANRIYSGQLLAAEGIGPWWFTCKRGDGSGYILTNKNYYRAELMHQLITNKAPHIQIAKMKSEGVKYIVAHPDNIAIFEQLEMSGLLLQNDNNKWLFTLN